MIRRKIFIAILVILSISSIFWIYFNAKKQGGSPLPTPIPKIFELSGIAPRNGVDTTIIPTTAIEFVFNKPINPNTLIVNVEPRSDYDFEVSDNRNTVFVRPIDTWTYGLDYTISLKVESEEGETIPEIIYPLRLKKATESDFNEVF